eukprot:194110-Chlamydomonas_euryale.AAC.3
MPGHMPARRTRKHGREHPCIHPSLAAFPPTSFSSAHYACPTHAPSPHMRPPHTCACPRSPADIPLPMDEAVARRRQKDGRALGRPGPGPVAAAQSAAEHAHIEAKWEAAESAAARQICGWASSRTTGDSRTDPSWPYESLAI